jgi:hypothetical protein
MEPGTMQARKIGWWERNKEAFFPVPLIGACGAAVFVVASRTARIGFRGAALLTGIVALPSLICGITAFAMRISPGRDGLRLHVHKDVEEPAAETLRNTWLYERDRYRRSVGRAQFYAVQFGAMATLFLGASALLVTPHWGLVAIVSDLPLGAEPYPLPYVILVGASLAAATATAFVVQFVKLLVRLSSYDISARAFSWSTRSLALVALGDLGLLLVLPITNAKWAILLGVFAGVTGDHTISLLLQRAGKSLGVAPPAERGPSPLLSIEGVLPEHVDRLQEEGIFSIHDLALIPTARLFFSTPYGLQMICDWQDQALLLTRWGADRARSLSDHLGIRGATDLRKLAARGVPESREPLRRTLRLDEDAPLAEKLSELANDEVTRRLELYAEKCLVRQPAHFDEERRESEAADPCIVDGTSSPGPEARRRPAAQEARPSRRRPVLLRILHVFA